MKKASYNETIFEGFSQKEAAFTFMPMSAKKKGKPLSPVELKEKMGERFKQLRKRLGYSSAEKFAYDHGFSRPTYGKWEQGKPDLNIELDTLIRLCDSYGVTLKEFFSEGFD